MTGYDSTVENPATQSKSSTSTTPCIFQRNNSNSETFLVIPKLVAYLHTTHMTALSTCYEAPLRHVAVYIFYPSPNEEQWRSTSKKLSSKDISDHPSLASTRFFSLRRRGRGVAEPMHKLPGIEPDFCKIPMPSPAYSLHTQTAPLCTYSHQTRPAQCVQSGPYLSRRCAEDSL